MSAVERFTLFAGALSAAATLLLVTAMAVLIIIA
jgi:hypothetical protein